MGDAFDAYQYLGHLKRRWRFVFVVCGVAVCGSLLVSLTLAKTYTATARVLIEPPAGTDTRSALVVSPIYLESLKTYEHFASSDSLFLRALNQFHLRHLYSGRPIESIKKSVLQVEIPRNTKILEIRAALPDPKLAQALALYVAEETVKLNRSVASDVDSDWSESLEKLKADARTALDRAEAAMARFAAERPGVDALAADIEAKGQVKGALSRQLIAADLDAATASPGADPNGWRADAGTRRDLLNKQLAALEPQLKAEQQTLEERKTELARLKEELRAARETYNRLESHLSETRATAGYRGEQLKIIDPGIVPERPSAPNLPLNLMAAAFIGILSAIVFLSFEFGYRPRSVPALARMPSRAAGNSADD